MIEDLIGFGDTVIFSIEIYNKKGDNPLSILTLNNKIITLGGSVIKISPATKSNLIDNNENKTSKKVLKMDSDAAKTTEVIP